MKTVTTSSGVTTIDVVQPLDDGEATELTRCEEAIERGVGDGSRRRVMGDTRYEMGDALRRIRDGRLHRATHGSFNSYCRERWDISSSRARHMIDASLVTENPSPTGDETVSEAQVHPLALLPPDEISPTPRDEAGEQGNPTAVWMTHELQLHADEAAALEQHEAVIARGINTFIEVGTALLHIRAERLYRVTHDTFQAYCRERWSMSRPRAYQLIEAATIAGNLSTTVDKPTNEWQLRPLASLSPEDQRTVWEQAVEESSGEQPTRLKVSELKKKLVHDRLVEGRREVGIVEQSPTKRRGDDLPPMSRKVLKESRAEMDANTKRDSKVRDLIEAIEKLAKPPIPLDEVATEILALNGPDVDWVGQSEEAMRNLQILERELHKINPIPARTINASQPEIRL